MVARSKGKRYGGPWYSNYRTLINFERGAKKHFPTLKHSNKRLGHKVWREYNVEIMVPEYEKRQVVIKFKPGLGSSPKVTVDGPTESPHRYGLGELCMWYPWDPQNNRWIHHDGLLHLLVLIQAHLFREAWWRETGGEQDGEWLGPEVSHENITDQLL